MTLPRLGMMRTQQAPEHESFVYKDNWHIFDPKDLEDFSSHSSSIFCPTGSITEKQVRVRQD
jgi:hypothetical protein